MQALSAALAPLLPGFTAQQVEEIDSTSTELMRRARNGQTAPVLLSARRQTAGRGRLGRPWHTDAQQALTFSLGLMLAPQDWSGLSLAVGVAVAEALHPRIRLKWPNDLWLDDRKMAGILIETAVPTPAPPPGSGPAARFAVVGVGINIGPRPADGLSTPPAWLQELEPGMDPAQTLERVAGPLVRALLEFESAGFGPFRTRFAQRDALQGRAVALSDGTRGTAQGVGEDGALLVHTAQGIHAVTSSEVSVRPAS